MKNYFTVVCAVLTFAVCLVVNQAHAESSWWDTGVSIYNNLNEGNDSTIKNVPSSAEIREAFKQALRMGTEHVVSQVGVVDGFNNDPSIHIPLPDELKTIKTMLSKIGMAGQVADLELKLNRAAESAAPTAKALFLKAIAEMTFDDIKTIYDGADDSATKYFQKNMSPTLKKEMQPIVQKTLAEVGAIKAYDTVINEYKTLPFVPDIKANLEEHVLEKGMEGIFYYIAQEEASIRKDPAKQTTALLKTVFGVK